ncbi:MAG TPA: protein-glutamate O-methyltransferase CheR [Methylophilaceae bacterium]|nr:protein-glutamate O-methyltransferase CheR [Methylophilaceae bacterium]
MNSPSPSPTDITLENFLKFRDFFYARTGIHFDEKKRYFVDKRLMERMKVTGRLRFSDYFGMLRLDEAGELQVLVNLMTTNETYFFREEYQFKSLVHAIMPEVVKRKNKGDLIRIWSIPSSSGEEPYSLAIYLLEHWPEVDEYNIELMASDIDTRVLKLAEKGVYQKRSLQYLPKPLIDKYFQQINETDFQIVQSLRDSITFTRVNVTDSAQTRDYRDFDIIFCRNLLIYFDDMSRREAADTFYDALVPGGFICLGHSESMSRISPLFTARKFPDGIVYQRPTS